MTATATSSQPPAPPPRIGVIGAGGWGRNLIGNLHELGALRAIADPQEANRQRMTEHYGPLPAYHDHRELLADRQIDAVAIATPVATHYEVVRACLEAGKDVFVEKPLTPAPAEAWALAELAEAEGRVLMVGHLLLFQPAILWLREFLGSGAIGRVRSIHQERLGLGRARDYENALWCLGSHDAAVQRFLLDAAPTAVQATGQCILQPRIEDDVHLHLRYPGGVESHLHCSWLWPEKRRSLVIVGTAGMVTYDELHQTVTHHRKGIDERLENRDEGAEVVYHGHGQPLRLELEHFLDAVRERHPCRSDGRFSAAIVDLLAEATAQLRSAPEG